MREARGGGCLQSLPGRKKQRDKVGIRGPEGRGSQSRRNPAGGARIPERPGETAEPHLILWVLKHIAHTALVFLEAEEDVPQPQGRHENHKGIKRQVPETDRLKKHGAAVGARPQVLTEQAEERLAPSAEAKPEQRAPAQTPSLPARPPRSAPACSRLAAPPARRLVERGGGVCSGSASLREKRRGESEVGCARDIGEKREGARKRKRRKGEGKSMKGRRRERRGRGSLGSEEREGRGEGGRVMG